jgi:hypothetical protein
MNRRIYLALLPIVLCCVPHPSLAQNAVKTVAQKQVNEPCKNRKLNLTGSYKGVLFTDKNQEKGTPATITVTENNFQLASDTLTGAGLISGVNSCGDVSIALKFTEASGQDAERVAELLKTSVSLDARTAGGGEVKWQASGHNVAMISPVIWATARDKTGNFAGADIAFVVCPEHPKCKRYPTCPCPEPPPNKPRE